MGFGLARFGEHDLRAELKTPREIGLIL
jgi:hypothetical protein